MSAAVSAKNKYSVKNGYRPSSKTPWGNPAVYFFSLVLWQSASRRYSISSLVVSVPIRRLLTILPACLILVIDNYINVINSDIFWGELVNSLIVGICTMIGVVVLGIMVSFVIADTVSAMRHLCTRCSPPASCFR